MTNHSIENKAVVYTYSIIYTFSYKHDLVSRNQLFRTKKRVRI